MPSGKKFEKPGKKTKPKKPKAPKTPGNGGDDSFGTAKIIMIPKIDKRELTIMIASDSLICTHKLSEKVEKYLEDRDQNKAKQKPGARDPWDEYVNSLHWLTPKPSNGNGNKITAADIKKAKFGFPASGLKKAMVSAVSAVEGVTMTLARQAFHVKGVNLNDYLEIQASPEMRDDIVRIGGKGPGTGTPSHRYRGAFDPWSAVVKIEFNNGVISAEQLVNLLNNAGFGVGLGEDRPGKSGGSWGRFHVDQDIPIKEMKLT